MLTQGLIVVCGVFPNPFSDRLNLCVTLAEPAELSVTVYDVAGERVDRFTTAGTPGNNDVIWAGVNLGGLRCASGIYLLRVSAQGPSGAQGGYWERAAIVR